MSRDKISKRDIEIMLAVGSYAAALSLAFQYLDAALGDTVGSNRARMTAVIRDNLAVFTRAMFGDRAVTKGITLNYTNRSGITTMTEIEDVLYDIRNDLIHECKISSVELVPHLMIEITGGKLRLPEQIIYGIIAVADAITM